MFFIFYFCFGHVIFSKIVNRFISKLKPNKMIDWLETTILYLFLKDTGWNIFFILCLFEIFAEYNSSKFKCWITSLFMISVLSRFKICFASFNFTFYVYCFYKVQIFRSQSNFKLPLLSISIKFSETVSPYIYLIYIYTCTSHFLYIIYISAAKLSYWLNIKNII